MANMHDCLENALAAGAAPAGQVRQAQSEFNQLVERYRTEMSPQEAQARAGADLKEATSRSLRSRRHAVLAQLQAIRRIDAAMAKAPDPAVALRNMIEASPGSGYTGESVASIERGLTKWINGRLNGFLERSGINMLGNSRDAALLTDVVRALHGDPVQSAVARQLADTIKDVQEDMRRMFNAWGGDIGKLDDFGVSHAHDARRIEKQGFPAWRDEIKTRLDWSRITDLTTGKPFAANKGDLPAPADIDRFLRDVFDGIITGGWSRQEPSMAVGGKALYNRRADPRILHFKSGADWIDYNKQFGQSDPFSSIVGGLHGLARDVAAMRVLSPNHRMGLEYAAQRATKIAADRGDTQLMKRVEKNGALARTMLSHFDGSVNQTEAKGWASFFANTRAYLVSTQLGSASLSSVTDSVTIAHAAQIVGMQPANVLTRSTQLMFSQATRQTAARMGYVADTLADAGAGVARFTGELIGGELAQRLSNFTIRASGLARLTDMRRLAWQMEFAGHLADNADRPFGRIDADLEQALSARGITAADWDRLRDPAGRFTDPDSGADFVSPFYWLEHQTGMPRAEAEGLAFRLQAVIEETMERAIPSASLEGRARLIGGTAPGTVPGELTRSLGTYKGFALSLMLNQVRTWQMLEPGWGRNGRARYAATMSAGLLMMGAVAVQLKELAKGRDPRPMTEPKFWMAALFQGGGLGIFGDFFSAETSRSGGGLAETLAGPVVGLGGDLIRPIASNVQRVAEGDEPLIGRDIANLVRRKTPVVSSHFATRSAWDHMVADTLQRWLDPEAEQQFRRLEKRYERDYGTPSFWAPGEPLPRRAPDLSNAVRTPQ